MDREKLRAKAKTLRAKGRSYEQIGKALGLSRGQVRTLLNPERLSAENRRRSAAKRRHERDTAGRCVTCGGSLSCSRSVQCGQCDRDQRRLEAKERTERFVGLRKEGLLNTEIAAREGVDVAVVATVLSRAGRYGIDSGCSPHYVEAAA